MSKRSAQQSKASRRQRVRRAAKQRLGNQTHVFRHRNSKGYDVEMIRDFLEQLLLEVRVQHFENLKMLNLLKEHGDVGTACKIADETISPSLVKQLQDFHKKYETQPIFGHAINGENATQDEINDVTEAYLEAMTQHRDEQIGHLEALQELFEESMTCLKLPFGISKEGHFCSPTRVLKVREWIDQYEREVASTM